MTFEQWWSEKYDTPQPKNPDGTPSETGYYTPSREALQEKRLMLKGWNGRDKELAEARNVIEYYALPANWENKIYCDDLEVSDDFEESWGGVKARKYLEENP